MESNDSSISSLSKTNVFEGHKQTWFW